MALTLKSLYGDRGTTTPEKSEPPDEQSLHAERAAIDERIAALEAGKTQARRVELAAELPKCSLADDVRSRELESEIKVAEKTLADKRNEWYVRTSNRQAQAISLSERGRTIRAELAATAPAELLAAIANVETQIEDAIAGSRSSDSLLVSKGTARFTSNHESIGAFVNAGREVVRKLGELKMQVLPDKQLTKEIAKVLRTLPSLNLELVGAQR